MKRNTGFTLNEIAILGFALTCTGIFAFVVVCILRILYKFAFGG